MHATRRAMIHAAATCIALMVSANAAMAQLPPQPMQPMDAAVGDIGPLSTDLRDFSVDLRGPAGFSRVYQVPGGSNLLMRGSGALYATFPRSAYKVTDEGVKVVIPAGTVYHIGEPWPTAMSHLPGTAPADADDENGEENSLRYLTRVPAVMTAQVNQPELTGAVREETTDLRGWVLAPRVVEKQPATDEGKSAPNHPLPVAPDGGPAIASDEHYREQRMAELMKRAVAAERSAQTAASGADDPAVARAMDSD